VLQLLRLRVRDDRVSPKKNFFRSLSFLFQFFSDLVAIQRGRGLNFIGKVQATVEKYRMLEEGDTVIVGVSGGIDSVALLHVLMALRDEYDLSLIVAHLDHGIRGEESRQEGDFVSGLAQGLGLPIKKAVADVPALAGKKRISLQEAAREARFAFYEEVRKKNSGQKVAMGRS
jgi:tRNA(Ile)-lysidine synthase